MNKWIWMLVLAMPMLMQAQEKNPHINGWIRSGNGALDRGDSTQALLFYDRVLAESPNDDRARFNKAITLAKPEKIEEAMTLYQVIAESNENETMQADAWYNMGNLAFRQQQFDKAVEYYKNALRLQPNDQDAKHNYYLAKNMQQQQQEQQQQQQQDQQGDQNQDQKDQNQENQQQQEQQDHQNQGDQQQDGQQDQEQEGNQEQESEPGQDEQEQQQGGQQGEEQEQLEGKEQKVPVARLSKEETERLLEALENQEKQLQGKLLEQKPKKKGRKPEKDW